MAAPNSKNTPVKKGSKFSLSEDKLVRYGGWALGAVMTLMLIGIFFGQYFPGLLNSLGLDWLYHSESGVYADCSKASNRNNPYCLSKDSGDSGWRDLKDTKGERTGFSLH